jgi:hypothetical protein
MIYVLFTCCLSVCVGLANLRSRDIEIVSISVMVMDVSVAIYLHSNMKIEIVRGMLFNMLGSAVAFYFYYEQFRTRSNILLASLIGSLIYGCYLLQKVFQILESKQITYNTL